MKIYFFRFCLFFIAVSPLKLLGQDTIKVTYYNLLNFPVQQADRVDTLKEILNFIKTDVLVVNELTSFNGGALIKNNALNVNGLSNYSSAIFMMVLILIIYYFMTIQNLVYTVKSKSQLLLEILVSMFYFTKIQIYQ